MGGGSRQLRYHSLFQTNSGPTPTQPSRYQGLTPGWHYLPLSGAAHRTGDATRRVRGASAQASGGNLSALSLAAAGWVAPRAWEGEGGWPRPTVRRRARTWRKQEALGMLRVGTAGRGLSSGLNLGDVHLRLGGALGFDQVELISSSPA